MKKTHVLEGVGAILYPFVDFCEGEFEVHLSKELFRIPLDLGHSVARKKMLSLLLSINTTD
jgi:hypothetical protein